MEPVVVLGEGDVIHAEHLLAEDEAPDLAALSGKFYHADDAELAHLPKANQPAGRTKLALVGAIGGTVALLGVGGFALTRAWKKRQVSPEPPPAASAAAAELSPAQTETEPRQYSFNWLKL